MTQPFPTKDGRWVLPHLQARMQKLLGCEATPESAAKAIAKWDALDLEAAIDEHRVCGGMVRSRPDGWQKSTARCWRPNPSLRCSR